MLLCLFERKLWTADNFNIAGIRAPRNVQKLKDRKTPQGNFFQ